MAIQPSFPHLAQGRVPDVSNYEELSESSPSLFHKVMHTRVENCFQNLSVPQPAIFFYDRMTILSEHEEWRLSVRVVQDEKRRPYLSRCKSNVRSQPMGTEPLRRIRRPCGVCTFSC